MTGRFPYGSLLSYKGAKDFLVRGKVIGYARRLDGLILCIIETEAHQIFIGAQSGMELISAEVNIENK
jgi:hypothetical protein